MSRPAMKVAAGRESKHMRKINEADAIRERVNSTAELKPCPWCGCRPTVEATHPGTDWVECECGVTGPDAKDGGWRGAAQRAVEAWNERHY